MPVTRTIGSNVRSHHYRIIVAGRLGRFTREVFEDLCVEYDGANTGLTGELDQAALYSVLNRILAFGLELVALNRLDDELKRSPDALARSEGLEPEPSDP
jgi:hypothetical protein